MLSNTCARNVLLFKRSTLYQLQNAYSIAVNVKPQNPSASNSSFVENVLHEYKTAKPFDQLPGPTKFQLWRGFLKGGEFAELSFNELILTCRNYFGDTYILPGVFGRPSTVITFNVNDFEKVHRTEGAYPERPGADSLIHYRNKRADKFFDDWPGLLVSGEKWAKFRHAVNPILMQPRHTKLYLDPMQNVSEEFIARIREIREPFTMEAPGDFIADINHLTFESVAVVALDQQLGLIRNNKAKTPEVQQLFDNVQTMIHSFFELDYKPSLYKLFPTPKYKRFEKAADAIFDATSKMVKDATKRIEAQGESAEGRSVFEKLVKIDAKIAMVMAMDMLMVGVDTTSTIISGIILAIAKSPEKQAKLREEILAVLPSKSDRFTIETLKNLPYLRACIKEAMRIYPINFGNTRKIGMDISLDGYQVPQGTHVLMPQNLLLKEERFFPRPLEFLPERWLRDGETSEPMLMADDLSPFIYLPFGLGPRTCVGKRIVDLELELTLANLVRNFHIEFNYPTENAFKNLFINYPAIPLKFKFTDVKY